MVQVINIKKEYEPILAFLYPEYSIIEGAHGSDKFITHHDVVSRMERDSLNVYYNDCIFISNRIFDEVWDEGVIKQKCVEYANGRLKNRKKKIEAEAETLVEDCIKFMYGVGDDDTESINELFDAFGSARFPVVFFTKAETIPVPRLVASLNTFISRILSCDDTSSVYYKGKAALYRKKIKGNMLKAMDDYIIRGKDSSGLSECKFFMDLQSNG